MSLQALLASDGFRDSVTKNLGKRLPAELYYEQTKLAEPGFRSLRAFVFSFRDESNERLAVLKALGTKADASASDKEARALLAEYLGIPVEFAPASGDARATLDELHKKLGAEIKMLSESCTLAAVLLEHLDAASASAVDQLLFKVSILNNGDTDGLVRNKAELDLTKYEESVPLMRTSPKKAPAAAAMAVPVAVVNADDEIRRGSVGKVEKNTMVEFWFEIDTATLSSRGRTALAAATRTSSLGWCKIILHDQASKSFRQTWFD